MNEAVHCILTKKMNKNIYGPTKWHFICIRTDLKVEIPIERMQILTSLITSLVYRKTGG